MGTVDYPLPQGKRLPATDPRHAQIVEWLEDESSLLDDDNLTGWLALLAPDIIYRAPVRTTRDHRSKGVFEAEMYHFNENIMTLMLKLMRLTQTDSAWSENPLSRTQRIVHKVRSYETDKADEYEVFSSIVLIRSRYDEPQLEFLPARRVDRIRVGDEWKLAARTIYFDQATLGVQNLAVYL
ncbi:aromatic-ring-hydroxylating dioxygenase subunit beta [Mycolicibacterium monacense DSM 44395]|nr:aromatic-ring-hydroxylating dioxygenase subunit beta [Mycolicibacterium monacense DSM 44395]QHP89403.1 aromatic-ring-hydroxylating dioxygenase subunit beta [Mycolicibacterium monacense DSM 44395]